MAARGSTVLELSTPAAVGRWIFPDNEAEQLRIAREVGESLDAAREIISSMVSMDRIDTASPPAALHRAATMKAAQLHLRQESVYGVEAYQLGGEAGGFLGTDPAIMDLVRPYRKAAVGSARRTADSAPIALLPGGVV